MASYRSILLVLLLAGLLVLQTKCELKDVDEVEDLDDLDDDDDAAPGAGAAHDEGDGAYAESWGEGEGVEGEEEEDFGIAVDDKDVVVLSKGNYTDFLKNNRYVMVEFYAPWCGHCQSLAPEYAEASTKLKGEVVLAKIDATVEHELAQDLDVQGYPTLFFYVDGVKRLYNGHRTGDEIVKWIQKKLGPAVTNVDNELDAETILATGNTIAVAFISDLKGKDAEEFASAARQEDGVSFYQTNQPHVAALFKLKEKQQPSLALLKKEHQTHSFFEGKFEKDEILNFVTTNKLPLVITFSRDTASLIFENEIKKQLLLFANSDELKQVKLPYEEAAESFRGKLIFVHVDTQDEDAKSILEFFGLTAGIPKVIAFSAEEQGRKHLLEKEITTDNLKTFAEDFLADKLPPFLKSDPIPEKNDDDVKIVVGHNFDEIVLDESKDVLLEIYAPWCGHCQALEPIYNKLAKRLRGVDSLVIAKMDGTTNEHSRAKSDGFPTILFFPAGNKSFDPVTVDADRSVKALYKFIKKHAAITFTLPKSSPSSSSSTSSSSSPSSSTEEEERLKDEL